jgi:hypothetical protein
MKIKQPGALSNLSTGSFDWMKIATIYRQWLSLHITLLITKHFWPTGSFNTDRSFLSHVIDLTKDARRQRI